MSGLLSRCPPLRAQAHTVRKPGCLRACCVRCPACPRWSFALRSCRSPTLPRVPVLTLFCPRALAWALLCSRGGGRVGLLVGVFACGWLGFGVCGLFVFAWVFACFDVGALVGWWDSVVPPPLPLLCLVGWCSRARVGGYGVCASRWAARWGGNGGGTTMSRHHALLGGAVPTVAYAWKREERRVGVPARSGEHTHRERERGSHRPGNCWHGRWRGAFLVVALACSLAWRIQSSSR